MNSSLSFCKTRSWIITSYAIKFMRQNTFFSSEISPSTWTKLFSYYSVDLHPFKYLIYFSLWKTGWDFFKQSKNHVNET